MKKEKIGKINLNKPNKLQRQQHRDACLGKAGKSTITKVKKKEAKKYLSGRKDKHKKNYYQNDNDFFIINF